MGGPMGPMGPGGPMMGGEGSSMMPFASPVMPGKIIPYCLVTALVPANAQQEAFLRAFASSGLQTQADIPLWSDYRIERAEVPAGTAAPDAAAAIHSDFAKLFIAAEVVGWGDFAEHQLPVVPPSKSFAAVKAAGKVRTEGKAYVVQDGDIIHWKIGQKGGK